MDIGRQHQLSRSAGKFSRHDFGRMIVDRFGALATLSAEDEALLCDMPLWSHWHSPSSFLPEGHALAEQPQLVVDGWACRMRPVGATRRQIVAFILPGDTLGLGDDIDPLGRTRVVTITGLTTLDARPLLEVRQGSNAQHVGLRAALNADAVAQRAALLDHLLRFGRQTAYERLSHLLLELADRLSSIGYLRQFPFPLTQTHLADALGLSAIHVNRTLQRLRSEGHLRMQHGLVEFLRRSDLSEMVGYRLGNDRADVSRPAGDRSWPTASAPQATSSSLPVPAPVGQ